jgi:plasmid stabilization system protein ParE
MLIAQCEHLAALSGTMGRSRDDLRPGLRSFPFRGFIIFFQYAEDRLEIVNILSGRRDLESHIDDD